jgi:hypothetical protein
MKAAVGGGWVITHLTDRVCEMRNESWAYRRLTGQDGLVRVRVEPGCDRSWMIEKGVAKARESDEKLAQLMAKDVMPSVARFRETSKRLATAMMTGEESPLIGVKRV